MTPILATFPAADGSARSLPVKQPMRHGFTLLEMVVVLSILGLVTALAAPSLLRTIAAWERQAQVDAVFDQVRGLPGRARGSGAPIAVDAGSLGGPGPPLTVREGWSLAVAAPWKVQANGVCEGGTLLLGDGARQWAIAVTAPFCEPRLAPPESP